MSDYTDFREWLSRQSLPRKTRDAGLAVAGWLFLLESGEASAESRRYAAEALREFRELCGR